MEMAVAGGSLIYRVEWTPHPRNKNLFQSTVLFRNGTVQKLSQVDPIDYSGKDKEALLQARVLSALLWKKIVEDLEDTKPLAMCCGCRIV